MALTDNPATGLTELQQQAARSLASGVSERAVAGEVKKHPKTITRWLKRLEFQAYLDEWRRKGEAKAEAKQDDLAEVQAELAKAEQALYKKTLGTLDGLLDNEDPKIKVSAAREARECYKGSGKGTGDERDFVALVMSGALEAEANGTAVVETIPFGGAMNPEAKN